MNASIPTVPVCAVLLLGLALGGCGDDASDALQDLREENARLREENARLRRQLEGAAPTLGSGLDPDEEEALKHFEKDPGAPDRVLDLLRRLSPEAAKRFDLDALLGPLLPQRGEEVVGVVTRLAPGRDVMGKLDQRLVGGVIDGRATQVHLEHWMANTGRHRWDVARPLIESGLRQAPKASRGVFLMTALGMERGPPEDWVTWATGAYEYTDAVRVALRARKRPK